MGDSSSKPETDNDDCTDVETKGCPDAENMMKGIFAICSRLISRYKMIIPQLKAIRDKLHGHKSSLDISRIVGTAVTVVGTIMVFTPITPAGIGLLAGGGATLVGAIVGDTVVSVVEAKKASHIVEQISSDVKKLTELLTILQDSCRELEENTGASADDACTIIVYAILAKGINVDTEKVGSDIASNVGRIVSIATDTAKLIGGESVGLLDDVLFGIASKISTAYGKIAAQVLPGTLKVTGFALAAVWAVTDVDIWIYGWLSRNPTEEQVTKFISELEAAAENLEEIKNSFKEVYEEFDKDR